MQRHVISAQQHVSTEQAPSSQRSVKWLASPQGRATCSSCSASDGEFHTTSAWSVSELLRWCLSIFFAIQKGGSLVFSSFFPVPPFAWRCLETADVVPGRRTGWCLRAAVVRPWVPTTGQRDCVQKEEKIMRARLSALARSRRNVTITHST